MAAAAYKVTMIAALGSPNGARKAFSLTASDVAAAYWLFADGQGTSVLNSQDVWIVDAILSAAGTDTVQVEFFVGGVANGTKLLNATSLATTVQRPFQLAPMRIAAGQSFAAIQRA